MYALDPDQPLQAPLAHMELVPDTVQVRQLLGHSEDTYAMLIQISKSPYILVSYYKYAPGTVAILCSHGIYCGYVLPEALFVYIVIKSTKPCMNVFSIQMTMPSVHAILSL